MSIIEKTEESLKQILERLSNPFFLSLLISFFTYNTKVTLAILFYNNDDMVLHQGKDLINYISTELNQPYSYGLPITFASIYTILFPFLKSGWKIFISYVGNKSDFLIKKQANQAPLSPGQSEELRAMNFDLKSINTQYHFRTVVQQSNFSGTWNLFINPNKTQTDFSIIDDKVVKWHGKNYRIESFCINESLKKATFILFSEQHLFPSFYFELLGFDWTHDNLKIRKTHEGSFYIPLIGLSHDKVGIILDRLT